MPSLTLTPLTTSIAARVDGVKLSEPVGDHVAAEIRAALAKYAVLIFRNQNMTLDHHKAVAGIFGPLVPAPSHKLFGIEEPVKRIELGVVSAKDDGAIPYAPSRRDEYQDWHIDSGFCRQVPSAACLRAEVLSPAGGDTCWTSMASVYEALSPTLQEFLESLTAINAAPPGFRGAVGYSQFPKEVQQRFEEEDAVNVHPVVVRHPNSGRKQLFVNPTYTAAIEKLNKRESNMLLRFLFNHLARPDFIYRHRWDMGDFIVWDELATLHLGPENFAPERKLVRIFAGLTTPTAANPAAIAIRH